MTPAFDPVALGLPPLAGLPWLPPTLFGFETAAVLAIALCVLGVVGSVVPLMPGAAFSLGGVGVYWYATGYADPGPVVLVALVGVAGLALLVDWFGGAITARAGGASVQTTGVAAVVGLALTFVAGPVGLLAGIAGTVFLLEFHQNGDVEQSLRLAGVATLGVLASAVMQAVLTGMVLVGMVLVVVL